MVETLHSRRLVRFADFEVDLQTGELRRGGVRLKLTGQPFQVLAILLECPGEVVMREELQKRLWPDTFVDVDHNLNTAINKIRDVLGDSAENPRYVETLARRGYRFVAPILEPKPIVKEAQSTIVEAPPGPSPSLRKPKSWLMTLSLSSLIAVAVLASAAVVLFVADVGGVRSKLLSRHSAQPQIRSLAVLPLANLSGDLQQEYFADGMTDALISELGQIGSLRVISRTSIMQYKDTKKPVPQIARELNVDAVIEGSVLRAGERVRISAELIAAVPERHIWAHNYGRDLRDVLSLQGEIARAIADEVQAHITPDVQARLAHARPANSMAHDAYLRGQFFLYKLTESDVQKATDYAQQAVDIDPAYAAAYGLMALSYWFSSENAYGRLRDKDAAEKAKAAASKALAIDEALAEPHEALGMVLHFHEWDWAGAEREFKRAIELNPNSSQAHSVYAWLPALLGRQPEAIREATQAAELDPFSPGAIHTLAAMYYYGRQYDQALEQGRKCVEMFPDEPACTIWLARILEAKGMYDQEITAWQKAMALSGAKAEEVAALGRAYRAGGIKGAWRWDLANWKERFGRDDFAPSSIARLYAQLGEKDEALDWLEKGLEEHDDEMFLIRADPHYDSLRSESRFEALLSRMNFPK